MNLDRGLIKQQARMLIKGKVGKLFVTIFIIGLCSSLFSGINYSFNIATSDFDEFESYYEDEYNHDDSDEGYFDDFEFNEDASDAASDFESFGTSYDGNAQIEPAGKYVIGGDSIADSPAVLAVMSVLGTLGTIATYLLMPLSVTLAAFFVEFIRGKEYELWDGITHIFKESFNKTYGKKFGVVFLKGLFEALWSMLFVIPGIVYSYKTYFAYQIMADNPNISVTQALNLSKKMTNGNKGELFLLDLSFLPWWFFVVVTLGFGSIYVDPYIHVTKALYYENFRLRALQQGRVTEDDFLSDMERYEKYAAQGAAPQQAPNQYFTPDAVQQYAPQNFYFNPAQPVADVQPQTEAQSADASDYTAPTYEPPTYEPPVYNTPTADEAPADYEVPATYAVPATDEAPQTDSDNADEAPVTDGDDADDGIPTVDAENVTDEFQE